MERLQLWNAAPVHPALQPLEWLRGKWRSLETEGSYPTIKPFDYQEEIEFIYLGQPMLNYVATSWSRINLKPMHFESGYLRIKPDTKDVSFMIAHNFGITSIEEGIRVLQTDYIMCIVSLHFKVVYRD